MATLKYSPKQYEEAVKANFSYSAAYREMTGSNSGSGMTFFKKQVVSLNIDTSHFNVKDARLNSYRKNGTRKILSHKDILVVNRLNGRREASKKLRKAMIEYGFVYECASCGNNGEWMGKEIRLEIDHINNNNVDNSPHNLRFLCPNCHSLEANSETWAKTWANGMGVAETKDKECPICGTNISRRSSRCWGCSNKPGSNPFGYPESESLCSDCGITVSRRAIRCKSCSNKNRSQTRIHWVSDERLGEMVWEKPLIVLASELGVSDNAIRKRCKNRGINLPSGGYWIRSENKRKKEQ